MQVYLLIACENIAAFTYQKICLTVWYLSGPRYGQL